MLGCFFVGIELEVLMEWGQGILPKPTLDTCTVTDRKGPRILPGFLASFARALGCQGVSLVLFLQLVKRRRLVPMDTLDKKGWWCDTCWATGETLLVCSGCHLRAYCCASCQKQGWKEHKPLCKAFCDLPPGKYPFSPSQDVFITALQDGGMPYGMARMLSAFNVRIGVAATHCSRLGRKETLQGLVEEITAHQFGAVLGNLFYGEKDLVISALTKAACKTRYVDILLTLMVLKRAFSIFDAGGGSKGDPLAAERITGVLSGSMPF